LGDRPSIIIAGAGIGGLTAALSLAAAGFRVLLCERARQLSEIGAGIQISPNAGRVLAGLGLEEAIAAVAIEPKAIDIRSGETGALIASVDLSGFARRYGAPYRVIHRADLQSILARGLAAEPSIQLRLGTTVAGVAAQAGGIVARLDRTGGSEMAEGAALIGADGVWSSLRLAIGGSPATPTGRVAWRTTISASDAPVPADRVGLWLGRDAHIVHYPMAGGRSVNVVAIVEEDWQREGWSEPGDPYRLAARFGEWSDDARAIIALDAEWRRWAIASVDQAGPFVRDRVALLGDAAHAMPPFLAQGAAMAIEDASVLAWRLAHAGDVVTALLAYQADRRPRTRRVAAAAWRAGHQYHFGGIAGAARDLALRAAGARLILRQNDWIYRWAPPSGGQ
jgi:salicylate hydroxylase